MNEKDPRVSVVIPCFNLGQYLGEAVDSVLAQTYQDFEIIVVDDGSTDDTTRQVLDSFERPKTRIIRTANQGPSAARNTGIREAHGEYILPLDADDKIGSRYMEKAVAVLDQRPEVGIVCCEAEFFGEVSGKWNLPEYSFPLVLLENMIVEPSFFRIADYKQTKGYNPNMLYNHEDHDFWLSIIELGRSVYRIPEVFYYYRRRTGSRDHQTTRNRQIECFAQLYRNHRALYEANLAFVFRYIAELRDAKRELEYLKGRKLMKLCERWWRLKKLLGF